MTHGPSRRAVPAARVLVPSRARRLDDWNPGILRNTELFMVNIATGKYKGGLNLPRYVFFDGKYNLRRHTRHHSHQPMSRVTSAASIAAWIKGWITLRKSSIGQRN